MQAPKCLLCGTAHWSRQPCAAAGKPNAVVADLKKRGGIKFVASLAVDERVAVAEHPRGGATVVVVNPAKPPETIDRKGRRKPLATSGSDGPAEAKSKRGRPAKVEGKPWEAEGISRALWYRRQKKDGGK